MNYTYNRDLHLPTDQHICIGVSGGADSIRLLYTIVCFFQQKNRKTDHIHVLHCHHNIRKASDQEQQLVKQACELYKTNYLCIKKERKEKEKKTERDLRKRRHEAFVSYMQQKNISDLFLGHNLDDRIETTFLNISRGCGLDGFLNMQSITPHFMTQDITIHRPLLHIPKKDITSLCLHNNIPFAVDESNDDTSFSQRNMLRKEIIPRLATLHNDNTTQFYTSIQHIYKNIEEQVGPKKLGPEKIESKQHTKKDNNIQPLQLLPDWEATWGYIRDINQSDITPTLFVTLIKHLSVYKNVQSSTIETIAQFLSKNTSGYKYWNGVYFFVAHQKIYVICAKKDFRTRETNITHPTQTTQTTIYTSKKVRYTSLEEEKTENTVRYIQKTDTINGKNAYERCSNQKIPLFLRPWCLIDITTSTICIPNITKKET